MSRFSRATQRMDKVIANRLSDGLGSFSSASGERAACLELMVDSSFAMSGVMEILTGNIKAVTVKASQMNGIKPVRGDLFELSGKRYIVEDTLSDDAYFPVYACMERT